MPNVTRTVLVPFTSRPGRPAGEDNDCAVQALATTANVPYAFAHKALRGQTGRVVGKGTPTIALAAYLDAPGAKCRARFVRLPYGSPTYGAPEGAAGVTLRTFCRQHPKGRFYVLVRGHALAVIDGDVVDGWEGSDLRLVKAAWKVRPKPRK